MTRLPLTFRIFSWSALGLIVGSALAGFMACAPFPPSNPHVPTVKLAVFNSSAVDDPNLPFKFLYFSSTPWQETTGRQPYFANGIYPDVLVGNPFAFQIKVNFDLNAFSILDGSGADIIDRQSPPRVNTQRTDGSFPQPGEFGWRQRPVPPADRSVAAIELASFCGLAPLYENATCQTSTDVALLISISPPRSGMVHGSTFNYTLVYRSSLGEQRSQIKAIYVERDKCKVLSMNSGPTDGVKAFSSVNVGWFINDCYASTLSLNGENHYLGDLATAHASPPDVASQSNLNGSYALSVPGVHSFDLILKATDAMGRPALVPTGRSNSLVQHHNVDACSISLADSMCDAACSQPNPPPKCPTPIPAECPSTANNHKVIWSFDIVCSQGGGTLYSYKETEPACLESDATSSVTNRLLPNCRIVKIIGPLVPNPTDPMGTASPMCSADAPLLTKQFCFTCSPPGPDKVVESGTGCGLGAAQQDAQTKRPVQQRCYVINEGECPKMP